MRRTILYLFAIALAARILISLVRATHGLTFTSAELEGRDDFGAIYVQQLAQLAQGVLPYKSIAISYPPLFLYALYPFYLLGADFASVPIIAADAATAVVVYWCVNRLAGSRLAIGAGLGYALSPFALYYEGYVWFSSQPMTFFAILSVYLLMRERRLLSFSALAVAILFKQEAIFLLPIYLPSLVLQDRRAALKALATFSTSVVGVSLPFLVVSARGYLSLVSYGLLGRWPGQPTPEQVASSAVCQNVLTRSSGELMSCTFGSTTYLQLVNNAVSPTAAFLDTLSYDLGIIAAIVTVPLFLVLTAVLYDLRRDKAIVPLVSAYAGVGFLILFSVVFHPVYRYYYLPVYVLLLTAVVNRGTLGVALAAPIASLLTPSGAFQELLPVLAVLGMGIALDLHSRRPKGEYAFPFSRPYAHGGEPGAQ